MDAREPVGRIYKSRVYLKLEVFGMFAPIEAAVQNSSK